MSKDKDLFENYFIKYKDDVYRVAYYYTRNSDEAEDLVQDTFIRAYKFFSKFKKNTNFKSWILKIMRNIYITKSKKKSKENVIRAQNDIRGIPVPEHSLFAGPSTFLPYLKDNKVAYFNIRLKGFGGAPITIDLKLSVQDSENSAGVVIDAIRYLKVARELGVVGALRGPSAWTQKTPPEQMMYNDAKAECQALANRKVTASVQKQVKK